MLCARVAEYTRSALLAASLIPACQNGRHVMCYAIPQCIAATVHWGQQARNTLDLAAAASKRSHGSRRLRMPFSTKIQCCNICTTIIAFNLSGGSSKVTCIPSCVFASRRTSWVGRDYFQAVIWTQEPGPLDRNTSCLPVTTVAALKLSLPRSLQASPATSLLSTLVDEHERDVTSMYHKVDSRDDIIPARW